MSSLKTNIAIFLGPILFIFIIEYLYLAKLSSSEDESYSRVRFLAIPKDHKYDMNALNELYVEGEINDVIIKEFKEAIKRNNISSAKVIFNSNGGSLDHAIELGMLIRSLEYSTDVGSYTGSWNSSKSGACFSACTAAFIGGKYRYFSDPSEFGVHQYRTVSDGSFQDYNSIESETQFYSGYYSSYIRDMGVDHDFYLYTVSQHFGEIEYLSTDELIKLNVANNGALKPNWELVSTSAGIELKGSQDRIGQHGDVTLTCSNGLEISFKSYRGGYKLDDLENMVFNLYLDESETDISSLVKIRQNDISKDYFVVSFKPQTIHLLKILSSEYLGLSYSEDKENKFLQQTDISNYRHQFLSFIESCNYSNKFY